MWVGMEMKTVCTSGIKNSASQTCTQCPPAEQLILLLLSVFSKETKNVVRARSATSRRIVHTYRTKTIALCIMHYACCAVSAVQSSPFFLSQKSGPRTNSPSFRFRPEILFFARLRGWAAEEADEEEELGISWVVFCGWREWM